MERRVTVEFGPSRSKRFGKAVAEAQSGAGECRELEPDRYRVSFVLGTDAGVYVGLARLLQRVRDWRATEVYQEEEPVSSFHAREMAWVCLLAAELVRGVSLPFLLRRLPPLCALSSVR